MKKGKNIMKKIIGIIFVSLMFANNGFAEMRLMEKQIMKQNYGRPDSSSIATACIDGYKFVIVRGTRAISVTQFYKEVDGKSLPAKC